MTEYPDTCTHSAEVFQSADSNNGMYCTVCYPELFSEKEAK